MFLTCREITEIVDHIDAVPIVRRWRGRFHMRTCHKCARFIAQYWATVAALRALATPAAPSGLDAFRAWHARAR